MNPAFTIEVAQHRPWCVERPDEVLALRGVDARLAADRGIHHAEHRRRDLHDVHAAQPGRRDEAREVGRRSPSQADHGIRAGEVGLPHHAPAERRDLDTLGVLGVGNLGEVHLVPTAELFAQRLRAGSERRGVHDEQLRGLRRQQVGQPAEQLAPDEHVVSRAAAHGDRRDSASGY
jgi:hypothetical protein